MFPAAEQFDGMRHALTAQKCTGRLVLYNIKPSVSFAVDFVAAARIWGGQGLFYSRKTNAIFLLVWFSIASRLLVW